MGGQHEVMVHWRLADSCNHLAKSRSNADRSALRCLRLVACSYSNTVTSSPSLLLSPSSLSLIEAVASR